MPELTVGTGRCRCAACGRSFGGVRAFDRHQRLTAGGRLVCREPSTLGMVERGGWWGQPVPAVASGVGRDGANGTAPVSVPSEVP